MKNILFVICLLFFLLVVFHSTTYANNVTLTKLDNIPDNAMAVCKVKSNNFVFLCLLNKQNHYNCKFVIGSMFTLPKCKPIEPVIVKPVMSNPFLDALRNKQLQKY